MNRLVPPLVLGALIAGLATFLVAQRQTERRLAEARLATDARFAHEQATHQAALATLQKRRPTVVTNVEVVTNAPRELTAAEIIERLVQLRAGTGFADIRSQRQAVVYFEQLTTLREAAFPAIREFLLRFDDADYTADARRPAVLVDADPAAAETDRRKWWRRLVLDPAGAARRPGARLDFAVPPTLRLGLVDVLHGVGGPEAEGILLEQLQRTGRAVEVAYLANTLRDLSGDRHRAPILETTHELLLSPPAPVTGARVDGAAKDYLYGVLAIFRDASFVPSARNLLVGTDGQLDRHAFDYLHGVLREQVLPIFHDAYNDPHLTNAWDRGALAASAVPHAGPNAFANALVTAAITDESLPADVRRRTVQGLGTLATAPRTDGERAGVEARIALLEDLVTRVTDRSLIIATGQSRQNLLHLLQGEAPHPARPDDDDDDDPQ